MKFVWLGCLVWSGLLFAGSPEQDLNVNARYTVESVELSGQPESDISNGLRSEMTQMVGAKLNPSALDEMARRLRRELHVRAVTHHVMRGRVPEHVRVVFEVRGVPTKFEASVPKFVYQNQEGFAGAVEGTATVGVHAFTIGAVSDGDALAERYTGVLARYEDKKLAGDRLGFRFDFESYREQWDPSAAAALEQPGAADHTSGLYRSRMNVQPVVTFALARPLTLSFGASFERFQDQSLAARTESANSMVTTLRYHRRLEGSGANQQIWDAGYSLRAATSLLGSDYAYARHQADVHYVFSWGNNAILDDAAVGVITGRAPLFERFVLGNSSMLLGWNKYELDPLGGNRMVYNSVEYRYRLLDVFYDSGAIWDQGETAVFRHSIGVGVRHNGLSVALAFPLKEGHIEPVFTVGMNY